MILPCRCFFFFLTLLDASVKYVFVPHRYIFLEYAAPTQALEAVKNADGYKLDKQHTFRVNLFTDFDKYVCNICEGLKKICIQTKMQVIFCPCVFFPGT